MNNIKSNIIFHLGVCLIAITFLILFAIQDIYSQQDKYKFDKLITNQENFPQQINCVIKDKKGFMWFGADYGLYRFDGYNFKIYAFKFGDSTFLGNNRVNCLYDDDRYLWIGTTSGLNRFDKTTERFKEFKLGFLDKFIYGIYPAANNELWIRTAGGLNRIDNTKEKYTKFKNVHDDTTGAIFFNELNTLCEDENGYLWIGTPENGLYRYDLKKKILKNYKFNPEDLNSLSSNEISKILEDSKGNLWISTYGGGLNEFDKKTEKFIRFHHDSLKRNSIISDVIQYMTIGIDEKLWIGTPKGISIFDPNSNIFTNFKRKDHPFSLSDISDIYCDNIGIIWICSKLDYGFSICNTLKWKFSYYKNISGDNDSLTYNPTTSVCEDHLGNFWIGTENGIDILNKRKEKIRHLEHNPKDTQSLGSNNVLNIYRDKKNFMWVGTRYGPLDRYDAEKDIFTHYYDSDGKVFRIWAILEDKMENLWLGLSESGIRVFDSNRTLIKEYLYTKTDSSNYSHIPIFDLFEDSKENMWIGTMQGLATIDLKTDSITFYKNIPNNSNPLSYNYVLGINEDDKGELWIGTWNGLNSFDITKKTFKQYNNIKDGGRDDIIGLMKDTKGNFWSTTDKGITMFNLNDKTFTNYGVSDGFQVNTFHIKPQQYKARDGEMFFAGSNGLTSFYPDSIPQNKNIPTIVLTDFKIFNKEVKLDTSITEKKLITISYKENFFSFDFASLDYTNPVKNQHAYILDGVDENWNNVGNVRTAHYTDIEPGEYTFRVKGSNNDGIWNEEGTSINIIITPPWWQTWWFKSCGAALIFMTVGYGYKKRINKIKKEKTSQEEFSRRLIESQEDERKRIASELHDTIAHDILLTKSKALLALRNPEDNENLKNALNEISDMSSETINDVRGISYNLHPHQLERLGFSEAIQSIINEVSKASEIYFSIKVDNVDDVISKEAEINLYRVIQEGINNIIKHSRATEAELKVIRLEHQIIISITDNGIGVNAENQHSSETKQGFGLSGIAERVKILKGDLKIESEVNNGTVLRILVPFSSKQIERG
ncbi:MAG: histidine kinase [Bacteroidota bacterium]|nr:histidine kinase [Bacteroidota bacterium]